MYVDDTYIRGQEKVKEIKSCRNMEGNIKKAERNMSSKADQETEKSI